MALPATDSRPAHVPLRWHPVTALEALAAVIGREGRMPTGYHLSRLGAPSRTTLRKLFGSAARAKRLAWELAHS